MRSLIRCRIEAVCAITCGSGTFVRIAFNNKPPIFFNTEPNEGTRSYRSRTLKNSRRGTYSHACTCFAVFYRLGGYSVLPSLILFAYVYLLAATAGSHAGGQVPSPGQPPGRVPASTPKQLPPSGPRPCHETERKAILHYQEVLSSTRVTRKMHRKGGGKLSKNHKIAAVRPNSNNLGWKARE